MKGNENIILKDFLFENRIDAFYGIKNPDGTSLSEEVDRIFVLILKNHMDIIQIKNKLAKDIRIEYVEFDYMGTGAGERVEVKTEDMIIPNDPQFGNQWGFRNTGQVMGGIPGTPGADMNMINAWNISTGNSSLKLAILDSGIPLNASEFSGRVTPGYDFANNDNNATDDQGHGSNVASIAAAKGNNNSVMAGVNWNCKIMPIKILNSSNSGFYSWWISGIIMAADSNAKVLNMSVGGSGFSQAMADAITYANSKGSIVVACMMNNNNNVPYYPAAFNNVISIGATNNRDQRVVPFCWGGGSSYGSHIDFSAPGDWILGINYLNPTATTYWCGISQATPAVSGLITSMLSLNSSLNFNSIYNLLKAGARDQVGPSKEDTPGFDNYFGWGRLDGYLVLNSFYTLNLTVFIQGFYDSQINNMVSDTVKVFLRNVTPPYSIIDSSKAVLNTLGNGTFYFTNVTNGINYYIVIKHRNSIETWSISGNAFSSRTMIYDFSPGANKAYSNNQAQVDLSPIRFAIFSGDIDQDGIIDAADLSMVDNDAFNAVSGYVRTDLNGDNIVDASDLSIVDNNAFLGIMLQRP